MLRKRPKTKTTEPSPELLEAFRRYTKRTGAASALVMVQRFGGISLKDLSEDQWDDVIWQCKNAGDARDPLPDRYDKEAGSIKRKVKGSRK